MNSGNEFMDVDGPEFIHEVNSEIASMRSSSSYREKMVNYGTSSPTNAADPANYNEIAIVDTNFLLSNLGTLNALLDISETRPGSLLVIIPWQVILELDGLKSKKIREESKVGMSARKAMKFLEINLRDKKHAIRGQRTDELLDSKNKNMGDDSILDCCLYFQQLTQKRLTLLSNDRNLCIKVMVHGIDSLSAESKSGLEALLNRVDRVKWGWQGTGAKKKEGIHHVVQKPSNSAAIAITTENNDMEIDGDEVYYEHDDMMMDADSIAKGSESSRWAMNGDELEPPKRPQVYIKDYSSIKPISYSNKSSWSSIHAPK